MHYCFVIQSVEPYCYDFIPIFALPEGFLYRQRYDERWVSGNIQSAPEEMIGQKVLVMFWDSTRQVLFPVRWGVVETAQSVGRILYFEYRLASLATYHCDLDPRTAQIEGFNQTFRGYHPHLFRPVAAPGLAEYVFSSEIGQQVGETSFDDLSNWGNVLDTVASADIFKGVEFLKILEVLDSSLAQIKPVSGIFGLRDGVTYRMKIFQMIPNPTGSHSQPHDIELNSFSDHIQILRRRQKAVGKYDLLTYVFRVSGVPAGEQTALEISPITEQANTPLNFLNLYLPVSVDRPSGFKVLLRLLVLLASLGLIFIPLFNHVYEPPVFAIGIIAFVLSLVGWENLMKEVSHLREG